MNPSKKKGTAEETLAVSYLNSQGIRARRMTLSGAKDKGDIELLDFPVIIEVKNEKKMSLSEYIDEANVEAKNSGVPFGVVLHKRLRKGNIKDHYVSMDVDTFVRLLCIMKE